MFRAAMEALSRPGRIRPLVTALAPPAPLTPELAALALALTDADTPVWLDAPLRADPAVAGFLRFHTGAPLVAEPGQAAFALIADPARCPPFTDFAQGTPAYPDASATLILAVDDPLGRAGRLRLRRAAGRIRGTARLAAGAPARRLGRALGREPCGLPARGRLSCSWRRAASPGCRARPGPSR